MRYSYAKKTTIFRKSKFLRIFYALTRSTTSLSCRDIASNVGNEKGLLNVSKPFSFVSKLSLIYSVVILKPSLQISFKVPRAVSRS